MTAILKPVSGVAWVRDVVAEDMIAVQRIYADHVSNGLGSFEEAAPDISEMTRRWKETCERRLPYIAAEIDGIVKGYAYAGPYRPRSAYRYTIEDSIYVAADAQRLGLGRMLLAELIDRCTALGYRQMVAVIGDSANLASVNLHLQLGFQQTGIQTDIGFKFGRWVDSVIMQRPLGEGGSTLPPP